MAKSYVSTTKEKELPNELTYRELAVYKDHLYYGGEDNKPVKLPNMQDVIGGEPIPGPPGPKGDKGDKGDQGDKGDKGDQGDRGDKGTDGINGVDGINGENGLDALCPTYAFLHMNQSDDPGNTVWTIPENTTNYFNRHPVVGDTYVQYVTNTTTNETWLCPISCEIYNGNLVARTRQSTCVVINGKQGEQGKPALYMKNPNLTCTDKPWNSLSFAIGEVAVKQYFNRLWEEGEQVFVIVKNTTTNIKWLCVAITHINTTSGTYSLSFSENNCSQLTGEQGEKGDDGLNPLCLTHTYMTMSIQQPPADGYTVLTDTLINQMFNRYPVVGDMVLQIQTVLNSNDVYIVPIFIDIVQEQLVMRWYQHNAKKINGTQGDKGDKGDTGTSITNITVEAV